MSPDPQETSQQCDACGHSLPELDAATRCPACGGLLSVIHTAPSSWGPALAQRFDARLADRAGTSGVWRFAELVLPSVRHPVTWPEGNTPLVARPQVSRWAGSNGLLLKHEGMNPTGSFKDRGMTVGVTHARRLGATAVACASTGNTSSALAAYASAAGMQALVFVPASGIATGKLAQTLAYGARTLLVRGDFDACLALAEAAGRELGIYLLNSINPFRLEGQKTIVLELLQQLGWDPPDWIALPAGNLGNTAAFGAALRDAVRLGLIQRVPRLLAVQADGAAPFAHSFATGFAARVPVRAQTVATAIRIGNPASWDRAVRAIRETNGVVTSVRDDEILEAKAVIDRSGVGCEPASAASVAGVRQLRGRGVIGPDERVVAILTGHILKDPGILLEYHQAGSAAAPGANRPIEIDATLQAVEGALRGA